MKTHHHPSFNNTTPSCLAFATLLLLSPSPFWMWAPAHYCASTSTPQKQGKIDEGFTNSPVCDLFEKCWNGPHYLSTFLANKMFNNQWKCAWLVQKWLVAWWKIFGIFDDWSRLTYVWMSARILTHPKTAPTMWTTIRESHAHRALTEEFKDLRVVTCMDVFTIYRKQQVML